MVVMISLCAISASPAIAGKLNVFIGGGYDKGPAAPFNQKPVNGGKYRNSWQAQLGAEYTSKKWRVQLMHSSTTDNGLHVSDGDINMLSVHYFLF